MTFQETEQYQMRIADGTMGTGWDAGFDYIVQLQHNSRMRILLGLACLTLSSHLGIR
jgi:hypothetical protein